MKSAPEARLTALAAVRITWITAIVVCALAILTGMLSGGEGGNPSRHLPGFAFADGADPPEPLPAAAPLDRAALAAIDDQAKAPKEKAAARQQSGTQSAGEQASGDSDESNSRNRAPNRSGSQPEDVGARAPADTNGPSSPQGPSVSPQRLPQVPSVELPETPSVVIQPDPPQSPSGGSGNPGNPGSSQPPIRVDVSETGVSASVSTPVADAEVTVGLG